MSRLARFLGLLISLVFPLFLYFLPPASVYYSGLLIKQLYSPTAYKQPNGFCPSAVCLPRKYLPCFQRGCNVCGFSSHKCGRRFYGYPVSYFSGGCRFRCFCRTLSDLHGLGRLRLCRNRAFCRCDRNGILRRNLLLQHKIGFCKFRLLCIFSGNKCRRGLSCHCGFCLSLCDSGIARSDQTLISR